MTAALATARAAGLAVDQAVVVHASNRVAVRLLPADVLARVAPAAHGRSAGFELDVARRLTATASPVGTLDPRVEPRVHAHTGFAVTFWTYYDTLPDPIAPPGYADALIGLHAGMRRADIAAPHFTARVAEAHALLGDRARTPDLPDADRELLRTTLHRVTASITTRGAREQLLHGEPHPGNLLNTRHGPRFVDLETAVRGPVEFDVAHAPNATAAHYPGLDDELLAHCRILVLAMITTWRWDRDDHLPNGHQHARDWLAQMRSALRRYGLEG